MVSEELYIHVVGWDRFQHGSTRNNPWIKNYLSQLHKDEYLDLSFHLRGVLHSIRLSYAASDRQLSGNTATLKRQLGQRVTTRDLESLIHAGFLELRASAVLAQSRVEEREIETRPLAAAAAEAPPKPPKQKPATERKPRPPDLLWDELVAIIGASPAGLERAKWNTAVKSLRESGATPDRLRAAATTYRRTYPDCALTPLALANNWTTLVSPTNGHAVESAEAFQARIRERERASSQLGWSIPVKGMDA